jgi:ABC transporter DrrB family efflux protein
MTSPETETTVAQLPARTQTAAADTHASMPAKAIRDVAVMTWRNLIHISRAPMQLSDVTIQPVLFTLLFVYVLGAGITIAHGGSYADYAIAGLLAMNLVTSTIGTAVGLSEDLGKGVIDRFRTLPMWRPAVLVGRSLTDFLASILCAAIVMVTGLVVGWHAGAGVGIGDVLAGVGLFLLFAYALSWGCACLGIYTQDVESSQGLGMVVLFPMALISNALVPTQHMPAFFRAIADWNPVSAVTAAARQLFGNPNPAATVHVWPMEHPIAASLIWSLGLLAIFAPLAVHLYRTRVKD